MHNYYNECSDYTTNDTIYAQLVYLAPRSIISETCS